MKTLGTLHPTDILARPDFVIPFVLATGTSNAQAFDVPTGAGYIAFSYNADIWVSYGSTAAAIPTTTSTANSSSNSELNPTARNITSTQACTGISIASDFVTKGSLAWYSRS